MNKTLRYAVLDENGIKLNSIIVDDPYPDLYWPGYGRYITCEFGESDSTPPNSLELRTGDRPFTYLTIRPNVSFSIGDTMDLSDGSVTFAPPPEPEAVNE